MPTRNLTRLLKDTEFKSASDYLNVAEPASEVEIIEETSSLDHTSPSSSDVEELESGIVLCSLNNNIITMWNFYSSHHYTASAIRKHASWGL